MPADQLPTATAPGAKPQTAIEPVRERDEKEIYKAILDLLGTVRSPPREPRIFFIPVKDSNLAPHSTASAHLRKAFRREGFIDITIRFYDGTKGGLMREYETMSGEMKKPGALALAYIDERAITPEELISHNNTHKTFKCIRESIPNGVAAKNELFMHVAFGLPVLDYVRNSADTAHKKELLQIIERMVDNDAKELDLLKADLENIFVSGFVLRLKKIEKLDINKEIAEGRNTIEAVMKAA
jgi:hypothetical protein